MPEVIGQCASIHNMWDARIRMPRTDTLPEMGWCCVESSLDGTVVYVILVNVDIAASTGIGAPKGGCNSPKPHVTTGVVDSSLLSARVFFRFHRLRDVLCTRWNMRTRLQF